MVTAVVTIIVFLVMITLHEFGHFASAKLLGVKVHEFSVGMGPAILKHQGKKTLYALRIFPIGGYCLLEGENGESDDPAAFSNQKLWKRFIIVAAGAVINILLGFAVFMVIVKMLSPVATNVIDKIDARSYLSQAGVMEDDRIVEINGHKVSVYNEIGLYTDEFDENTESVEIAVKRDGKKLKFDITPSVSLTEIFYKEDYIEIADTVNGITETYKIDYTEKTAAIRDSLDTDYQSYKRYIIGFDAKHIEITALNVIPEAWKYTRFVIKSIFSAIGDMITGRIGLNNLSGPVGVAGVIDDAVNSGKDSLLNVLFIVAMLTVNLGIFNLLPLPALDGGRLFFMLVEFIRRKPIPPEKEGMVHTVGLVLLLILAAFVCYSDIIKLIAK